RQPLINLWLSPFVSYIVRALRRLQKHPELVNRLPDVLTPLGQRDYSLRLGQPCVRCRPYQQPVPLIAPLIRDSSLAEPWPRPITIAKRPAVRVSRLRHRPLQPAPAAYVGFAQIATRAAFVEVQFPSARRILPVHERLPVDVPKMPS